MILSFTHPGLRALGRSLCAVALTVVATSMPARAQDQAVAEDEAVKKAAAALDAAMAAVDAAAPLPEDAAAAAAIPPAAEGAIPEDAAAAAALPADPAVAADAIRLSDTEIAAAAFQSFCNEWLEKLVEREVQNVSHIQWVTTDIGVRGTFVGYTRQGQCLTKTGTDAVPVGKLVYKQITYEKKGPTVSAAEMSAARPLDVAEVTEIFRYGDGKWIY